jgi:diguanylate cyclase (GGDEF)-like protein
LTLLKNTEKKEIFVAILLVFFTLLIFLLQYIGFERHLAIDLTNLDKISTRDDRPFNGSSTSSYLKTPAGIEFTCQIIKKDFAWPYCELVIDVKQLVNKSEAQGLDLSNFDQIGLWIQHNHAKQPGTRVELHNFNSAYSTEGAINTLKYNTIEFSEKHVPYPTWIKFHSFYVPTWWNSKHNLNLDKGGTEFSNIYSIAITTGGLVQEGNYKLTLERIEFKGKYYKTESLLLFLVVIWSLATGYFIRRFSSANRNFKSAYEQQKVWEYKATNDVLTGALNRAGLRKCFDKFTPIDLQQLSLIFLDIDHFKQINDTYGHGLGDEILKQFVVEVNNASRSSDVLARWGGEEFLLICPETSLSQAMQVAEKVRLTIEKAMWPEKIQLTCSLGVAQMFDEDLNTFIERADKALYNAKNTGRNRAVSA